MTPNIYIDTQSPQTRGELVYRKSDYSFNYQYGTQLFEKGRSWICFGKCEIAIDLADGRFLGCSGFTNYQMWSQTTLSAPSISDKCCIRVINYSEMNSGIAYNYGQNESYKEHFDHLSGWYCIGDPGTDADQVVEFAVGCVAVLRASKMKACWLQESTGELKSDM